MSNPQFQRRTHRARLALERWGAAHPDVWRLVDEVRQGRRDEWPPYCFLPLPGAAEVMVRWASDRGIRLASAADAIRPASELTLFASWRLTQGIYRYDPAMYEAIIETPITGDIPGDLLQHLPEWCVYIETPEMMAPLIDGDETRLHGFWAWHDHSSTETSDVLTLGLDTDEQLAIGHIPLVGTLDDALEQVEADWRASVERENATLGPPEKYAKAARKMFSPILSLLLYLCAEASEIGGNGNRWPANPKPTRTKQGWRLFPADRPTTWDVGVRVGAALRRAYHAEETERDSVPSGRHLRPHVRRAHWHTFLTGKGRSERRAKWMPPIPVNVLDPSSLPSVIKEVR